MTCPAWMLWVTTRTYMPRYLRELMIGVRAILVDAYEARRQPGRRVGAILLAGGTMHLWASEKARRLNEGYATSGVVLGPIYQHWGLIDGKEVRYEFAREDREPPQVDTAVLDDLTYLGEGKWLRNERLR